MQPKKEGGKKKPVLVPKNYNKVMRLKCGKIGTVADCWKKCEGKLGC